MKKIFFAYILAAITIMSACAQGASDPGQVSFPALNGVAVTLQQITESPRAVLFVWTTWCPYCRKEISHLNNEFSDYGSIDFYYVNSGESRATVQKFVTKQKLAPHVTDRIILDRENILTNKYSVVGIPTFLILEKGKVIYRSHHMTKETIEQALNNG
ncbi:MAG: TlpA disulfide reductase family protein [Candidatus Omnitrophota bacterium]